MGGRDQAGSGSLRVERVGEELGEGSSGLLDFLNSAALATDAMLGRVRNAGTPAVEDGPAFAADLRRNLDSMKSIFAVLRRRAQALPVEDPASFISGIGGIESQLRLQFGTVTEGLKEFRVLEEVRRDRAPQSGTGKRSLSEPHTDLAPGHAPAREGSCATTTSWWLRNRARPGPVAVVDLARLEACLGVETEHELLAVGDCPLGHRAVDRPVEAEVMGEVVLGRSGGEQAQRLLVEEEVRDQAAPARAEDAGATSPR